MGNMLLSAICGCGIDKGDLAMEHLRLCRSRWTVSIQHDMLVIKFWNQWSQNETKWVKMTEATKIQGVDYYSSSPQSHPAFVSHGCYYRSFCASRPSCSWWWRASSIPHRLREISPRQSNDFANFSPKKPPGRMELHVYSRSTMTHVERLGVKLQASSCGQGSVRTV